MIKGDKNGFLEKIFIHIKNKKNKKNRKHGFIITDSIIAVSILFLSMYLFSTFNNNTNSILEQNKRYRELVHIAELELNRELDNVKKGDLTPEENYNSKNITINKSIDIVDKPRGVYVVTIDASQDDKKITLQGYEQWKEDDVVVPIIE